MTRTFDRASCERHAREFALRVLSSSIASLVSTSILHLAWIASAVVLSAFAVAALALWLRRA